MPILESQLPKSTRAMPIGQEGAWENTHRLSADTAEWIDAGAVASSEWTSKDKDPLKPLVAFNMSLGDGHTSTM